MSRIDILRKLGVNDSNIYSIAYERIGKSDSDYIFKILEKINNEDRQELKGKLIEYFVNNISIELSIDDYNKYANLQLTINVGDEFKKLLPKITDLDSCANKQYTKEALHTYKSDLYINGLNNITLAKFDDKKEYNTKYCQKYIKDFYKQIFNNISSKQYPGDESYVPRQDHGALNHLRSLKFGIMILKFIAKKNES